MDDTCQKASGTLHSCLTFPKYCCRQPMLCIPCSDSAELCGSCCAGSFIRFQS